MGNITLEEKKMMLMERKKILKAQIRETEMELAKYGAVTVCEGISSDSSGEDDADYPRSEGVTRALGRPELRHKSRALHRLRTRVAATAELGSLAVTRVVTTTAHKLPALKSEDGTIPPVKGPWVKYSCECELKESPLLIEYYKHTTSEEPPRTYFRDVRLKLSDRRLSLEYARCRAKEGVARADPQIEVGFLAAMMEERADRGAILRKLMEDYGEDVLVKEAESTAMYMRGPRGGFELEWEIEPRDGDFGSFRHTFAVEAAKRGDQEYNETMAKIIKKLLKSHDKKDITKSLLMMINLARDGDEMKGASETEDMAPPARGEEMADGNTAQGATERKMADGNAASRSRGKESAKGTNASRGGETAVAANAASGRETANRATSRVDVKNAKRQSKSERENKGPKKGKSKSVATESRRKKRERSPESMDT